STCPSTACGAIPSSTSRCPAATAPRRTGTSGCRTATHAGRRRRSGRSRSRKPAERLSAAGAYDPCVPAAYVFVDRWFVPAPIGDVYDAIGSPLDYPKWWGDVFPETGGDDGPPRPGRRNTITARGFLPYKLHFVAEVTEADR